MKVLKLYQQGDVLIKAISKIPPNAEQVPADSRGTVLAEGEATGHFHGMNPSTTTLYKENGETFLRVDEDTSITHQEHNAFTVPAGDYKIDIVQEYDHFAEEARNVAD